LRSPFALVLLTTNPSPAIIAAVHRRLLLPIVILAACLCALFLGSWFDGHGVLAGWTWDSPLR